MPFRYSSDFRHQVCERMLAGELVKELSGELSVDIEHAVQVAPPGLD